jgi:hypothetical protein
VQVERAIDGKLNKIIFMHELTFIRKSSKLG